MLKLTELQVSSRNHPIGLDEQPVFSWKMVSDIPDTIQTAYRVRVGSWDTGRVESGDSLFVPYAGPALQPRTAYRVQVEVWDNHGQTACAETGFEIGLRGPDGFAAQWIADPFEGDHPLPVFETEFTIDTPVTTARLYITAHGIYEAELDGAKLGDAWFAPGWTSYHKRLQYQTIPVDTARLTPGRHTLRVTVVQGGVGICSQPQPLRRPGGAAGDAMPGRPNRRHRRGLAGYHRPGATCRILLWRGL